MKELVRLSNPVEVTYVTALLRGGGIEPVIFDGHMSALYAGIAMMPQRVMVGDDELIAARRILDEAGVEYPTS